MTKFHRLRVKDVSRETAECVSVAFEIPEELRADYTFIQGQYLTLKAVLEGEEVRRSYSICSAPHEGELRVAIKHLEGGVFSTFANTELKAGMTLDVMTPMGRFYTDMDANHVRNYVFFAAGSGITPILSLIKTALKTEPQSNITLIYGNKGRNSIIFKEEIEGLKNKFMERFSCYHILTQEFTDTPLFHGRIDRDKTKNILQALVNPKLVDEAFICGPEEMVHAVRAELEAAGIASNQIHFELFTASSPAKSSLTAAKIAERSGKISHITIILDGRRLQFEMSGSDSNILDEALKHGADLPYACKGGVCCTCRAKVTEGNVEMAINYSLEPEEVKNGYVLTCQSFPQTDHVVIDYDTK